MKRYIYFTVTLISLIFLSGCGKQQSAEESDSEKLSVVTTLFPMYDFTRIIGGEYVDVKLLLPPGIEAHSFEPSPKDMITITNADFFIYTGPFMEPWVHDFLDGIDNSSLSVINVSEGLKFHSPEDEDEDHHEDKDHHKDEDHHEDKHHEDEHHEDEHHHGDIDPHVWLDFENAIRIVDAVCKGLKEKMPEHAEEFMQRAEDYKEKLKALDEKCRLELAVYKNKTLFFGGHFAFGYFAERYGLELKSAYKGFAPNSQPTPKNLINLVDSIKETGAKAIFFEEIVNPKIAQVLSEETGAELLLLHAAHNLTKEEMKRGETFLSIMDANLERLKKGLGE